MLPVRWLERRSPTVRRRLLLALAVAEDRLAQAHTKAAMGFLQETSGALPFERALAIFFRLVGAPVRIRRHVTVQVLSVLGRGGDAERPGAGGVVVETAPEERDDLVGRVLRRLRGRRAPRLRERLGRAAERAERLVRTAYLEGAAGVAAALEGVMAPAEAVQVYLDALDVGPGWAERIFHEAVAQMGTA